VKGKVFVKSDPLSRRGSPVAKIQCDGEPLRTGRPFFQTLDYSFSQID
jgi:hypothetical protein